MNHDIESQRSAVIAIVGRPNVGKSSLLNRLVGQKIAIVSPKPQTTRKRIMGVRTEEDCQLVFMDTPGLLKPRDPLGDYMVKSIIAAMDGVDYCLLVAEAGTGISKADLDLIERFRSQHIPALLAINKIDLLPDKTKLMEQIAAYSETYPFQAVVPVSARTGSGMDRLYQELSDLAEKGGFFFSEDMLTDQPEESIAAETVREKALRFLDKEVPHGLAAVTERMTEEGDLLEIDVTIYTEKASHKGILIGKNGSMLKKIGTEARLDLEKFFGCRVNLRLWVKVKEDWRQRPQTLQSLGFSEKSLEL